jgi:DNA-binding IclR family transcriptional regulator
VIAIRNGELKMTRLSPAVGRIVSVLNFFAEHPKQAFTLTQIVKSLRLSRATCHALLMGLVEGGYLYRNADKSYVLGPALLALARNAQAHFSPLDVARQELRLLADELDVIAAALFLDGEEIVVRERAASLTHLGWAPPPGQRYPMHPWGAVFLANLPEEMVEESFDKASPPLSEAQREEERRQIAFGRDHGFLFGVYASGRILEARDIPPENRRNMGRFLTALDPQSSYALQFLVAPVMNERGRVAVAIALSGFGRMHSGAEVAEVGARLVEACRRITTFIAGKQATAAL